MNAGRSAYTPFLSLCNFAWGAVLQQLQQVCEAG